MSCSLLTLWVCGLMSNLLRSCRLTRAQLGCPPLQNIKRGCSGAQPPGGAITSRKATFPGEILSARAQGFFLKLYLGSEAG